MIKKFLSLLLAVMMVVSVMAVGVVTSSAATSGGFKPEANKLYFDVEGTGWDMGDKDKVAFHIFGGDLGTEENPSKGLAWGAKKAQGTATTGESGVFEIDPVKKLGITLNAGVQYKVIFTHVVSNNWAEQTYDLLFTTDCFGHVAYCDGTEYENPVDSSKKTLAAFWKDMDATKVGPVLQISSIGNVVGTCPEEGKTPASIFVDFISVVSKDSGTTGLVNARKYVVDVGTKTEQKLIDDIGAGLGLTKDDIKTAFEENTKDTDEGAITTVWSYNDSTLPAGETPHTHTPGEAVKENEVPASCKAEGSYDEVVYCTECGEQISRETKTIDKLEHTPGEPVQDQMAGYPATCTEDGLKVMVTYCSECGEEISREEVTIKAEGHKLHLVEEVPATATKDGMKAHYACDNCDKLFADADGAVEVTADSLVIPAEFVRGDVNKDSVFDTTDVTVLQRKLVEYEVESYNEVAADADLDGTVDVIDVTLMQRVLVDITTWEEWDAKHPVAP